MGYEKRFVESFKKPRKGEGYLDGLKLYNKRRAENGKSEKKD